MTKEQLISELKEIAHNMLEGGCTDEDCPEEHTERFETQKETYRDAGNYFRGVEEV